MTASRVGSRASGPSTWLWIGLIGLASLGLSRLFACATPFAALATLAALTLHRRDALALVLFTWLANQAVGFGLLHYPWTATTIAWGIAIAIASVAGLLAATQVACRTPSYWWAAPIGLIAAFGAYELVLFATAVLLASGTHAFTAAILARIFAINVVAFGLLIGVERLTHGASRSKVSACVGSSL